MTLTDLMAEVITALTSVVPLATLTIFATAGVVIALAGRFGGRIIKSLR